MYICYIKIYNGMYAILNFCKDNKYAENPCFFTV